MSCNNLEGVNANMMHSEVLVMNLSADGWEVVDAGPSTAGNYSQSTDSTRLYDIAKPMADMPYQGNCQIVGVMNGMDLSSAGLTKSDGSPVMGFYDLDLTIDQDASTETTVVYSQPDHYAYYTGVVVDKIDFMKIQNETLAE
ncbi:MAG: hypothetical protein U9Q15_01645 [Patescibacteria group bacterium]|nr:hypothetical protein [Patescibacteria group bacterium]